jgi:acyl carrier protein
LLASLAEFPAEVAASGGEINTVSAPASITAADQVRGYVAEVMMKPVERIDINRPLNMLGLDSIMAVQLKNELEARHGVLVEISEIIPSSIRDLARKIPV